MSSKGHTTDVMALLNDPLNKRRRYNEYHAYVRGAIVKVSCRNFVTYDSCECEPGPHLNVVVGPNGSGKSTIISAICLGLAGKTKLLDKADHISSFIKHGKDFAEIDIHLHAGEGNVVKISRKITPDDRSEWKLNDRIVPERRILEEIKKFNIQVDNLCQFLPQERVVEFARMDPKMLLRQTDVAIRGEEKAREREEIARKEREFKRIRENSTFLENRLEQLRKDQELARAEVERFQQLQEIQNKLKIMNAFKHVIEYKEKKAIVDAMKHDIQERESQLQKAKDEMLPFQNQHRQLSDEYQRIKSSKDAAERKVQDADRERRLAFDNIQKSIEKAAEIGARIDGTRKEMTEQGSRKKRLESEIRDLKTRLGQLESMQSIADKLTDVRKQERDINVEMSESQNKIEDIVRECDSNKKRLRHEEERRSRLQNRKTMMIDQLRTMDPGCFRAYEWIQQNMSKFRGPVHGPLFVELEFEDAKIGQYLENVCKAFYLKAFVTERNEDQVLLASELQEKMKLSVTIMNCDLAQRSERRYPIQSAQLPHFGLDGYLIDKLRGPEAVLRALADLSSIDCTAIGKHDTPIKFGESIKTTDLSTYITPDSVYSQFRSRYGQRQQVVQSRSLKDIQLFQQTGTSRDEIQTIEHTIMDLGNRIQVLEGERAKYDAKLKSLAQKARELQAIRNELSQKKAEYARIESSIALKQNQLNSMRSVQDLQTIVSQLEQERVSLATARAAELQFAKTVLQKKFQSLAALDEVEIKRLIAHRKVSHIEEVVRSKESRIQEYAADLNKRKGVLVSCDQELRALKATAKTMSDDLTEEEKRKWQELPNSLQELSQLVVDYQTRAECLHARNPRILEEYRARALEIEKLERDFQAAVRTHSAEQQDIEIQKRAWLDAIQPSMNKIDQQFGEYLKAIGCAGAVELYRPPDGDLDNYEARISVKFRPEEQLQILDSKRQSGGVSQIEEENGNSPFTPRALWAYNYLNQSQSSNKDLVVNNITIWFLS
eukprot:TRINITY_DN8518_c0_g1_i2.p1 TRINITY_DN8518_c0_g1~~TRINITY_DN8518_c0_g1_i2.p1  ORF type:complete len:1003 (+),score=209.56 TRINITY_DN8518_c0_g1_i2:52-3060(+)